MEFFTKEEIAKELRIHPRTVQRWLQNGLLHGYKLGKGKTSLWRVPKQEYRAFLEKHRN